ncbi:IclR family transcriptional regulator [Tessaracoccus lubricantis]|uniref:IclR family transcriptional regulator n=1 Tax=Tessaracoccus lubricantis TaxID=545543 RepID=A0ABP9F9A5_9ACTN
MARLTPALMRALDIMELFVERGARFNAAQITEATGLPRTTVHELLTTLVHRGYLNRDEVGNFELGVRTAQLGNAYAARFDLLAAATEVARDVGQATGHTCSVALREGAEVFYLAKVEGNEALSLISSVGKRAPASCTGLGKALLSELDPLELDRLYPTGQLPALSAHSITDLGELKKALAEARARGYAVEREESGPGVACAASVIRDAAGTAVAALSVSVPLARWDQFPEQHWADIALEGAGRLSVQLGALPRR